MIAMISRVGSVSRSGEVRVYVWCAEARASSRTRNACKETQRVVYGGKWKRRCGISGLMRALGSLG